MDKETNIKFLREDFYTKENVIFINDLTKIVKNFDKTVKKVIIIKIKAMDYIVWLIIQRCAQWDISWCKIPLSDDQRDPGYTSAYLS